MRAAASPHVMHAAVENCFSGAPGETGRKLWRTDRLGDKLFLLLLSTKTPDFTSFARQFCGDGQQGETKSCDELVARLRNGQQWQFRLRANPVHSVKDVANASERGKVYAHVTTEQQKDWLFKKSSTCGFELDEKAYDVVQSELIRFKRQNKSVTLGVATFEGILRLSDTSLFITSLKEGIGRAKAYGCGLLTVARLP
jgi:CRISPR system Cascade subunit CasE